MIRFHHIVLLILSLLVIHVEAGEVHWNVFAAQDHDWYEDMKGASAYYYGSVTPEIGFKYNYNNAGTVITSISPAMEFMNCGWNGVYWVIANYGDQLCCSSDFLSKTLLVDFGYANPGVGGNISVPPPGKSFYAACFGDAREYDKLTQQYHDVNFYAWVQINVSRTDGISVGASGISIGDGIIVGQYATIPGEVPEPAPEPTSGLLLIFGTAALLLRRKTREVKLL